MAKRELAKISEEKLPGINWLALVGPIFAGAIIAALIILFDRDTFKIIAAMFSVSVVGGGKFTILYALKPEAGITPYEIMFTVMYIEWSQGIMFLYNIELIRRVKIIRKKLDQVRLAAQRMFEKWPIMRQLAFITLVVFVALPFQGTGAIGGVVFSSVLGLKHHKTLIGIFLGSFLGNAALAVGVDVFQETFAEIVKNPMVTVSVIVILVLFIWIINILMVKTMKELAQEAQKQKALAAVAKAVKIHSFDMKKIDLRIMLDDNLTFEN